MSDNTFRRLGTLARPNERTTFEDGQECPSSCHTKPTRTRREFVREACCGFGGLALAALLHDEQLRAAGSNPLAAKRPHVEPKAKSVIFLFMAGGPSHVETFDPKPLLNKLNGQKRP